MVRRAARRWLAALALGAMLFATAAWSQTVRIVLRWKDVPGATGYELQIARDSAFVEMVLQTRTTTPGYRWEQLPTVTHWWRVRSFDAEGRPSEWSAPRTIAVDTAVPLPVTPADGARIACGAPVEITLEGSPLIKDYLLQVSGSRDLSGARELHSKTPSFSLPGLAAGTWFWQARGIDLRDRTSGPAPLRSFTVHLAAPRLAPVADLTVGSSVTLGWAPVACAKSYVVEATADGRERTSSPTAATSLTFKPGAPADYRWRVAAQDPEGALGEWSPEATFKVRLPSPVPREEAVSTRAELSWQSTPGAVSYKVELSSRAELKAPATTTATVTATTWRSGDLKPGTWFWRVTARDAANHTSLPSDVRQFKVLPLGPLAAPGFVVPEADGVLPDGRELDVSWNPVPLATRYEVELDGASQPPVRAATARLSNVVEGNHRLRVRALADPYRQSPWSAVREFFVGIPPVVQAKVEQVGREVRVALLDARGRPVADARPLFAVKAGRLSQAELRDRRWVMRWEPPTNPPDDVLLITEREFHLEQPLVVPAALDWTATVLAGGVFSGGAVTSPSAVVGLWRRLPALDGRPGIELRVGVYHAASSTSVGQQRFDGSVWLVPASILVTWRQEVGAYLLGAGLGPSVQLSFVQVGPVREVRVLPGFELTAAVSRRLGPGSVVVEVGFLFSRLDSSIARLNAGGIGARVGYALSFGGTGAR